MWFKLVGVRLGNGNKDYPDGDEVQTVEPWSPPKTWEGLSSEMLNAALNDIDAGMPNGQRYSCASSGWSYYNYNSRYGTAGKSKRSTS